jgi:serine/threonine-protein kinase
MVVQTIDGVSFQMKEPYDFSFLSTFGKVFRVFDQSSSGCICFGVEKNDKRYFLKFAGAHTINDALRHIEDTILRLKYSVPKYKEMKHHLLVNLVDSMEIGGGYLTIFDWFNGESCGYPQREMWKKFNSLPAEKKLPVYDGILAFHAHVAKCGYVAIDFNDQAALYNFDSGDFRICDIDFYAKQYYMNGYSRIWGDPSLMSPEEKRNGAVVDEVSNVYAMGAVAFVFFSEDDKDSPEKWTLNNELYKVAKRAINEQRSQRQQSISSLINEWNAVK